MRRAKTSRGTFYEHFTSKDECFVALLTEANAEQVRHITSAVDPTAPWDPVPRQRRMPGFNAAKRAPAGH